MKTFAVEFARLVTLLVTCLLILVAVKAPANEPVPAAPVAGSLFDAMVRAEQSLTAAASKSEKAWMDAKLAAEKRLADLKAKAEVEIKAAAVADYTPADYSDNKMKKKDGDLSIPLKRTQDILQHL